MQRRWYRKCIRAAGMTNGFCSLFATTASSVWNPPWFSYFSFYHVGWCSCHCASPAAPLTRGQDQLPALRAARAVLKQQLKESTKEIRKEAGATQILILVGDMSPELARVDACEQTMAMWLHARLSISFLPGSPQISSHEKSPRLNDGWPGLAHCSPCSWVRLQHSCFRKGCGWAAAEIVLIFFKSRRWAMRMHTPKALKSRSLLLFEKSRLLGHQSDCLESQGWRVRECYVRKCCKERQMWIQSRHQVRRFPCWILRQSHFHVPKSLWVFYLLRPLAKSEFSWPCGLSWTNVPPLPFYPWCGEQILEPNPIDTEQNKVKTSQNTVRSLLSRSHRHGAK